MTCPSCSSNKVFKNDLDGSTCCAECGTLLDNGEFVSHEKQVVYRKPREEYAYKNMLCEDWFHRITSFYKLDPDLVRQGKELLDEYQTELPKQAYKEVSVGIICYLSRYHRPNWTYNDYIAEFPYELHRATVIKSFLIVGGEPKTWENSPPNQIDSTIKLLYPLITKIVFKETTPYGFNITLLKNYSKKLLDLNGYYDLNAGKKVKPLIVVTACISALHLRTKIEKKIATRSTKLMKKNKKKPILKWNFKQFEAIGCASPSYLKNLYDSFYTLLNNCIKQLTWIEMSGLQEVLYHLDDIFEFFLPKDKKQPLLKLESEEYLPLSYLSNLARAQAIDADLELAEKHLAENTVPQDTSSQLFYIYTALKAGYHSSDILNWNPNYIRNLSNMLHFRSYHAFDEIKNKDLDRVELGLDDICNEEIDYYLSTEIPKRR